MCLVVLFYFLKKKFIEKIGYFGYKLLYNDGIGIDMY